MQSMESGSVDAQRVIARSDGWRLASAGLLAAWLGTTAWLFWKLETTGLPLAGSESPAAEGLAIFDPGSLDPAAVVAVSAGIGGSSRAMVVHLRDAACPCTGAADEHFEALVRRHWNAGVVFAIADAPGTRPAPIRGLEHLPRMAAPDAERLWRDLPSAPAVAVFNAVGRPVYLGPYADTARCGAARGGAAEAALAATLDGRGVPSMPVLTAGCFCRQVPGAGDGRPRPIAFN
jgi:Domain of unknown function (DUF6436)